ncbi:hypothetical protein BGP77_13190 [Saccharospirillum sp. MSK14-1]|uniref:hypothetical protein n=1 Tax=Saccharospirillum sp. MSK14-1 TaxID=1897632 RepID=UPI000D37B0B5|nr:hypothetical protein [Saccharospirillum sp. MSK14-1]PTY37452.1 hypothetical protein BGP77_13190 [Saccharospirillum sp. MSK14-1]
MPVLEKIKSSINSKIRLYWLIGTLGNMLLGFGLGGFFWPYATPNGFLFLVLLAGVAANVWVMRRNRQYQQQQIEFSRDEILREQRREERKEHSEKVLLALQQTLPLVETQLIKVRSDMESSVSVLTERFQYMNNILSMGGNRSDNTNILKSLGDIDQFAQQVKISMDELWETLAQSEQVEAESQLKVNALSGELSQLETATEAVEKSPRKSIYWH